MPGTRMLCGTVLDPVDMFIDNFVDEMVLILNKAIFSRNILLTSIAWAVRLSWLENAHSRPLCFGGRF